MIDIQAIRDWERNTHTGAFTGSIPSVKACKSILRLCDEVDRLRETLEIVQIGLTGYVTLEEAKCLYDEIESTLYPPEDKP